MDIKRLAVAMVVAMAVMIGWQYLVMKPMYDAHPEWKQSPTDATRTAPAPATTPATAIQPTTTGSAVPTTQGTAGTGPQMTAGLEVKGAPQAAGVPLGSDKHQDPTYSLQVQTTARGAGLDAVVLNQFWATVERKNPYTFEKPFEGPGNADVSRVLATRWISVNGQQVELADDNWVLENQTPNTATYSITVGPVRVQKTVEVRPKDGGAPGSMGYEVGVVQTITNTGSTPVAVATAINGPVPPVREIDSLDDRQVIAGYDVGGAVAAIGHMFAAFEPSKPALDLMKDDKGNRFNWFGASSVYFDAILRPLPAAGEQGKTMPIRSVTAQALNPSDPPDNRMITTGLQTDVVSLAPGEKAALPMEVFFGPKQRSLLNNAYYSSPPLGYDTTLATNITGCGTYCTFGWLINLLVALLGFFYMIVRDWGIAIILLVAVVRLLLHPITKKSQVSMVKMGKMAPEIERLKKKYGDNKEELNKAMMQVYKEQGATPILGCLPIILQMPIWIALYTSLQNTFELRQQPFLYGLTWIDDLAKPDRLIWFPNHPINFYFGHLDALNLLPILMGLVFWLQQKYTPKPPAQTPEQEQQYKMMQWMSLIFPVFLYNGPAGLNLYILTSTAVGIVESKRIRDHIKQREEAEKEGKIIVEPTRKMRRGDDHGSADVRRHDPKTPKGGLSGWLADLQAKAEEMRRQQERKK